MSLLLSVVSLVLNQMVALQSSFVLSFCSRPVQGVVAVWAAVHGG